MSNTLFIQDNIASVFVFMFILSFQDKTIRLLILYLFLEKHVCLKNVNQ
jgi:hypothetical protein